MSDPYRRIFGIETEYGLSYAQGSNDPLELTVEQAARELFADVVAWGRSTNVFLPNAARLYLDVGSHPEYATAECDDVVDLVAQDSAGQLIMLDLLQSAQERVVAKGGTGTLHMFKTNVDSQGNSFGCHENYLIRRRADFPGMQRLLIPYLVTRQIVSGAGHIFNTPRGSRYCFSQRADHMWETVSSATTRARPMINTRDEAHADSSRYRRMHVIVGDSSIATPTTMLKVGATDLVLRGIEQGLSLPQVQLERPTQAIRAVSHDLSGRAPLALAAGGTVSALDIQRSYLDFARRAAAEQPSAIDERVLGLWERTLAGLEDEDMSGVDKEIDWVIKRDLLDRYSARLGAGLSDPRLARLELAYHDISPSTGLARRMEESGLMKRIVTPELCEQSRSDPPASTRAALRGRFIKAAREASIDYTVDWTTLRPGRDASHAITLDDPFSSTDARVDALLESLPSYGAESRP